MTKNEEILNNMHPVKIQVIRDLEAKAKGKGLKSTAPFIMEAMAALRAQNLSFTPEEVSVLLEILTQDMSKQEKERVDMMKRVVKEQGNK